jgi:hypothetical protein
MHAGDSARLETTMAKAPAKGSTHRDDGQARALQERIRATFGAATQRIELRRDGLSPCMFDGSLIAKATSRGDGSRPWYEIAAYARADGGYVAAMTVIRTAASQQDIHWARTFQSMAELCTYFESHDPASDVSVPKDLANAASPMAETALRAAALRQRIAAAQTDYQSAVGDLLNAITDASDVRREA